MCFAVGGLFLVKYADLDKEAIKDSGKAGAAVSKAMDAIHISNKGTLLSVGVVCCLLGVCFIGFVACCCSKLN